MTNVTAILSMLHEPVQTNSATRRFRSEPVLEWTLERLAMSERITDVAIICWEDQLQDVAPLAADAEVHVLAKGPRMNLPSIESVAAARRWADGWRGGLFSTCDFDRGFHGPAVKEVVEKLDCHAVVLIDPAAGLVDAKLIDQIIAHAQARENVELCFTQAAPGLAGVLLRPALVDRLALARTHPGRLLCYLPESPMRDPISGDGCVPIAAPIARTTRSFRLDSDRQIQRLTQASVHLNGELVGSDAEDLIHRLHWTSEIDPLPREIVLELNTTRATSPVFWPGRFTKIDRANLSPELAERIFEQLGSCDDVRLTLGGVGDPLLHPQVFEIVGLARSHGIRAIHVETDLLPEDPSLIEKLVESEIDVVSVHLPAMTHATYASLMGADRFTQVIDNIRRFVTCRQQRGIGLPLLAPLFTKCQANLVEMEAWYDQWLKAVGSVVVVEPTSYGGRVPDCGVADMSAPKRRACNRINSRMTLLSNGMAVSCEQDVLAKQLVGDVLSHTIQEIWQEGFAGLRQSHGCGQWASRPLCAGCREWHRT
jgi:hypothetical protein